VKVVTIKNCYIYQICLLDGFVKYDYGWSIAIDSSISWYGPVMVLFKLGVSNIDFCECKFVIILLGYCAGCVYQ